MSRENIDDSDSMNRRKFLRNASLGVGSMTLFSGAAVAKPGNKSTENGEHENVTIIHDGEKTLVTKWSTTDGRTFKYRLHKNSGKVEYEEISDEINSHRNRASPTQIETYSDIFAQSDTITGIYESSCGSFYSEHGYARVSAQLTQDVGSLPVSALAGAICTTLSKAFGAAFGDIIDIVGGSFCSVLAELAQRYIGGSAVTFTVFDREESPVGITIPVVAVGVGGGYNVPVQRLDATRGVATGAHISPITT